MAKNRNPYYKVFVGDEMRLLKRLSTDAYGLYGILRNWVHDAEPYAHLVDAHGMPLTDEALIDMSGLRASAFRSAFEDLRALKVVQPAAAWLAEVRAKEHNRYIELASELVAGVRCLTVVAGDGSVPETRSVNDVLLIPALADQQVRTAFGQRTGAARKRGGTSGGTSRPPYTGDVRSFPTSPVRGDVTGDLDAQSHEHEHDFDQGSDFSSSRSLPVLIPGPRERDLSTAHAREKAAQAALPMTWTAYRTHCMRVAQWEKRLTAQHPRGLSDEQFDAAYQAEFHESWEAWQWMKNRMEAAIPQPCQDGLHQFAEGNNFCKYCPYIRVPGEP